MKKMILILLCNFYFSLFAGLPDASQPFVFVPLPISTEDIAVLEQLEIKDAPQFEYYGSIKEIKAHVAPFLRELGNTKEEDIARACMVINSIVQYAGTMVNKEAVMIFLRASEPNDSFAIPRWHIDGGYYKPYDKNPPKFVATFQGPHTLFFPATSEEREIVLDGLRNENEKAGRIHAAKQLDPAKSVSPKQGEGAFFLVGDCDNAAVHSEPNITSKRLFLACVFGDKEQITEVKKRFQK